MQRGPMLIDYQKYQPHYQTVSQNIINGPNPNRRCTDVACVFVFLLVLAAFFGLGVMEISEFNGLPPKPNPQPNPNDQTGELYLTRNVPIIAAGVGTAIIVSFIYVFLLKAFPRPMVYFMIFLSMALILGLLVVGLFTSLALAISMAVYFVIYSILLCCLRKKIEIGIAMVKIATEFITEKMSVFLTPIVKLVLTLLIGSFFAYSVNAMGAII